MQMINVIAAKAVGAQSIPPGPYTCRWAPCVRGHDPARNSSRAVGIGPSQVGAGRNHPRADTRDEIKTVV